MKIKAILLLSIFMILAGCGSQSGDTTKEAEDADSEFAGQSVYDLPNEQFSESAIDMLMDCGLADDDIAKLEKEILPKESPESGPYIDISGKEIADISFEQLEPEIFEVSCTPDNPSIWLDAGHEMIVYASSYASNDDGDSELYLIGADGNGLWRLTNNDWHDCDPDWSANRSRIVFIAGSLGDYDIFTMDIDGTNIQRLTDNAWNDVDPSWSPDGSMLVFASDQDGDYDIYSMNADGSNIQQLTQNEEHELDPDWSPDGSKIVFISDNDGDHEIFTMNTDGGNIQQLTDNDRDDRQPSWSPDGTKIAFLSDLDRNREIFTMNADGSNINRLTFTGRRVAYPAWSPDGSIITFQSHYVVDRVAYSMLFTMKSDGTNIQSLFDKTQHDWSYTSSEWVTQTVAQPRITTDLAVPVETPTVTITPTTSTVYKPATRHPIQPLLADIQMVSPEIGWALDRDASSVLRTEDGGETWLFVIDLDYRYGALSAIDEETFNYSFGFFDMTAGEQPWGIREYIKEQIVYGAEPVLVDWHFLDEMNFWVAVEIHVKVGGLRGIYRTHDGGASWESLWLECDMGYLFSGILMVDEKTGWVSSHRWYYEENDYEKRWVIYKTINGGDTWAPKQLPAPTDPLADQVDTCNSRLHKTGANDLLQIIVTCWDEQGQKIGRWYYKSRLAGQSWRNWLMEGDVFFLNASAGWRSINQDDGTAIIERTNDGGATWDEMGILPGQGAFQFWDEQAGWALARNGQVSVLWITADGGSTWEEKETFPSEASLTFIDRNHGWAYEEPDLWRTRDGGETWQEYLPAVIATHLELTSVHMINEKEGWGIRSVPWSNEASVYITKDGGNTWRDVTPPKGQSGMNRSGVIGDFYDAKHGWILFTYEDGTSCRGIKSDLNVWYTSDGGQSWRISESFEVDINYVDDYIDCDASLDMVDADTGWLHISNRAASSADQYNNFFYRTTDGGATWNLVTPHWCEDSCRTHFPLSNLVFLDDRNGWLLEGGGHGDFGESPPKFHTTSDGGYEWSVRELDPPLDNPQLLTDSDYCTTHDLNLLSEQVARFYVRCFVADDNSEEVQVTGYLYATDDGGNTWYTNTLFQEALYEYELSRKQWPKLVFFDADRGLLLGREIWRTEDGGITWIQINTVAWDGQFSFIDWQRGWAVAKGNGIERALVYTTNGGGTWEIIRALEVYQD